MRQANRGIARLWLSLGLFAIVSTQSALALNKCVDANGRVSYSDQPCPAESKKQDVSPALKSAADAIPPSSPPSGAPLRAVTPPPRDCSNARNRDQCELVNAGMQACKDTNQGKEHFECFAAYVKAHRQ